MESLVEKLHEYTKRLNISMEARRELNFNVQHNIKPYWSETCTAITLTLEDYRKEDYKLKRIDNTIIIEL